jgi:serine/threonine-protein kinase
MSFIPGANVGPYRIVEQAERSGIATSYTAYQPLLGRYVSMIVVPAIDRDNVPLQLQYQRQLELVLTLRHPNILAVIDRGEHLDVPFVVTETIESESLADRLGTPWSLGEVTRVLRPIAAALDYAHRHGVVHGDVRPAAILLTPDGTPILSGFGLLTRPLALPAGTGAGDTGRYPPSLDEEVAQAQPGDRRGLALIAYEMLTGRSTDVEAAELEQPLAPAQIGSPLLAAPVERVLLRELSGEPAERYPDATSFIDDLSASIESMRPNGVAVAPATHATVPSQPPHEASTDARRRRITVALIFAALALLGALVILLRGGDAARPIAAPARTPAANAPAAGAGSTSTPAPAGSGASTGTSTGQAGVAAAAPGQAGATASPPASTPSGQPAADGGATAVPAGGTPARSGSGLTLIVPTPDTGSGAHPGATPAASSIGAPVAQASATPSGGAPADATVAPTPAPGPATPPTATAGSTRLPATWRAVGDPSGRWQLDDQGRVAGRTETGASVLLFPESVDDVAFSATVNTTSCQATLVFRAHDDENLLMAIYIPDGLPAPGAAGGGAWLYQRVEGLDLPIRAVRPPTVRPAGEPVRLKVITSGPDITIFLNDALALQAVDTAPRSGRLGLMVYSTSGRLCEATFGDIER